MEWGLLRVGTKITIKCKYSISKKSRIDTFLKSGACGCRECKRRSIISYSDKELLEEFLFIESLTRIDNKDGYSSPIWSYKCKVCSYDILTRNGLCSGVFKTTIPSLRAGNKPCRCGGNLILSKSQKEFMVDVAIKDNKLPYIRDGAIFRSGRKDKVPVKCKHGSSTLNYESIKTLNSRPRCCSVEGSNGFGYYPLRSEETDTLYLLKLTDNHETFYKIGRTFNLDKRVKELARYSGYSIGLIGFLKDNHEKVFSLEQRLLLNDLLSWKYTPFKTFGGSRECFSQNMLCDRFPLILLNDLTVL